MNRNNELIQRLPALLPKALAWAEGTAALIDQHGSPLMDEELAMGRRVGVLHPGRVRVAVVEQMPLPDDPELRQAGEEVGLFTPRTAGLTLGYGVILVQREIYPGLVAHELRHVHQFEAAGGITAFLPRYLLELLQFGYDDAPSEVDARNYEHLAARPETNQ